MALPEVIGIIKTKKELSETTELLRQQIKLLAEIKHLLEQK